MMLILRPTLIVTVPQIAMLTFYALLRAVIGGSEGLGIGYAIFASIVFLGTGIGAMIDFFDNVLPEHRREQLRLRDERAQLSRQIDAEIGIPRIGDRR